MRYRRQMLPVFLVVLAAVSSAQDLTVVSAYEHPEGVIRAIVRNDGKARLDLPDPGLSTAEGKPVHVVWAMAEPRAISPGECAFVGLRLGQRAQTPGQGSQYVIDFGDVKVPAGLPGPPALVLTYLVQDPANGCAYAYVRNLTTRHCRLTGITVDGNPIRIENAIQLPAGQLNLAAGQWTPVEHPPYDVPWVPVEAHSPELGRVSLGGKLFRPEHTARTLDGEVPVIVSCLHEFGTPEEAGAEAVGRTQGAVGSVRTIKFCNEDLSGGAPETYGGVADRYRIEPQTTYRLDGPPEGYVSTVFAGAQLTRRYAVPGIFHAILYGEDIHSERHDLFALSTLRNVAYTCLAAGSKGLALCPMTRTELPPEFQRGLEALRKELDRLQPWVALSEPSDWASTSDDAWCSVHLLICGTDGWLLIALPRKPEAPGAGKKVATAAIQPPLAVMPPAKTAYEMGGSHESLPLKRLDKGFELELLPAEGARAFYIPVEPR